MLAGAILAVAIISGLLILRGPSFVWQATKIFSSSAQDKKVAKTQENLTSSLAQNLAGQIIKDPLFLEKTQGWAALDETGQEMAPETIFPLPRIPDSEVIISEDSSLQTVQAYTDKISQTLEQHNQTFREKLTQSDLDIINQALDTNDFKDMDKLLDLNQETIKDLKKIPAPRTWQAIHKEQISIFLLYSELLTAIKNTEKDPLKTIVALERFEQLPDLMEGLLDKITNLAAANP